MNNTKQKKKHDRKRTAKTRATSTTTVPPALTTPRQNSLSCLPDVPASMLQEKTQIKTSTTGSATQEKQTINHVPRALTTSTQTL